jgi:sugar lactone lactonase YvrE
VGAVNDGWQIIGEGRDKLGESVLWHPEQQALWWIDFFEPGIRRFDPESGSVRRFPIATTETIGSIAFARNGRLLAAIDSGVHFFDPETGELTLFADPIHGQKAIGYNDAKVDRDGRYWVGTYDRSEREPLGGLYRIDANAGATLCASGYVVSNGPAFSPGGDVLYFSDSMGRKLLAFALYRRSGSLSPPRTITEFAEEDGVPDGLCVDRSGTIYLAHYGGACVSVLGPDGSLRERITLPVRNVTSCCFGARDLDTLYVTTAFDNGRHPLDGALFARKLGTRGLPEPIFAGGQA